MLLLFFVCFWKKYKEMLGNMGKCENVVARPVLDIPILFPRLRLRNTKKIPSLGKARD